MVLIGVDRNPVLYRVSQASNDYQHENLAAIISGPEPPSSLVPIISGPGLLEFRQTKFRLAIMRD